MEIAVSVKPPDLIICGPKACHLFFFFLRWVLVFELAPYSSLTSSYDSVFHYRLCGTTSDGGQGPLTVNTTSPSHEKNSAKLKKKNC